MKQKERTQQEVLDQVRVILGAITEADYPSLKNVTARFAHLSKNLEGMPPYADTNLRKRCLVVVGPKSDGSYARISELPEDLHRVADAFQAFSGENQDLWQLPIWFEYEHARVLKRCLFALNMDEDLRVKFAMFGYQPH